MSSQKPLLDPMISSPDSNEYFNSISHLIGAILSISALAVLVSLAAIAGKPAHVVGFAIYGTSLFLSFLFSCLLHFFLLFAIRHSLFPSPSRLAMILCRFNWIPRRRNGRAFDHGWLPCQIHPS